jgi:hypothetical protein
VGDVFKPDVSSIFDDMGEITPPLETHSAG